jgi:hypothetical protein
MESFGVKNFIVSVLFCGAVQAQEAPSAQQNSSAEYMAR